METEDREEVVGDEEKCGRVEDKEQAKNVEKD